MARERDEELPVLRKGRFHDRRRPPGRGDLHRDGMPKFEGGGPAAT